MAKQTKTAYWQKWNSIYKDELLKNIMPFWTKYGWDRKNGGVYTCLNRDGSIMDTTKSVWFQGRYGWMAAYAYNHVKKDKTFLEISKSCCEFLENHCFDTDGRAFFEVTAEGVGLRKRRYVFSECFAAIAYAEYSLASGDETWAGKALELFKRIRKFVAESDKWMPSKYTSALTAQGHSLTMILINVANVLKQVSDDPVLDEQITTSIDLLVKYFIHPEFKALLETVGPNGEFIDTLSGRTINPGHCIETSWFLMDVAVERNDPKLLDTALQILDWSWVWGWDKKYGGIISFKDCRNLPPQCYEQDMKFWWPRCGYLHRDGTVAQPAKGNIFKGPFHIPRMLAKTWLLTKDM